MVCLTRHLKTIEIDKAVRGIKYRFNNSGFFKGLSILLWTFCNFSVYTTLSVILILVWDWPVLLDTPLDPSFFKKIYNFIEEIFNKIKIIQILEKTKKIRKNGE